MVYIGKSLSKTSRQVSAGWYLSKEVEWGLHTSPRTMVVLCPPNSSLATYRLPVRQSNHNSGRTSGRWSDALLKAKVKSHCPSATTTPDQMVAPGKNKVSPSGTWDFPYIKTRRGRSTYRQPRRLLFQLISSPSTLFY